VYLVYVSAHLNCQQLLYTIWDKEPVASYLSKPN